ncbi:MAG: polyprenyl synthetase family protein [Ignavibacterium sp.]|uniref:polyprenyl synthetase family protein n=1 Tax=Ignavibacterium sp. TaxID=2651167 RepID=UPI0040491CDB
MKKFNPLKYAAIYEEERKKIDKMLTSSLKKRKPKSLYEPASYILQSSGKRLRPLLVLLSAKAAGGKFKDVYNAAVAVEIMHNFTLVHDDIMDNADLRRGNQTLHIKYDLNTAILAGDSLLSIAYEFLLKDCNGNTKAAVSTFTQGLIEVCEGQSMDTEFEKRNDVNLKEYITMITKKTAAMVKMCCELGSILVDGKKSDINALSNYGLNLGIAFQIQDDLLDLIGEQDKFGKTVGGDLIAGKKTFLFIKAFEKADGQDKNDLQRLIDNKGIKPEEVSHYRNLFEKLGVLEDARSEIRKYTNRALSSVDMISNKSEIGIFHWLADSLIKRNR